MSLKMFEGNVEGIGSILTIDMDYYIFYNNYINYFTDIYEIQMIFADMDWVSCAIQMKGSNTFHQDFGRRKGGLLTVPTRTWGNI